jgi:hypothetical protein
MRRALFVVLSVGALVLVPGGSSFGSALARHGKALTSPEQAGYAVTGARFIGVETSVRLPDAARFSREIGQLTVSVQLWTSYSVVDLKLTACTDAACKRGGRPAVRRYHLEFVIYSTSTGALICSTAASGNERCPDVPRSWNRATFAPGRMVSITLVYPTPQDVLFAGVNSQQYLYFTQSPLHFSQARIGAEFGATPSSQVRIGSLRKAMPLVIFDRHPHFAEIVSAGGDSGDIGSSDEPWTYHKVSMADGHSDVDARPGRLGHYGTGFTDYLEP